ncbi:5'-methylthioadenosine/S-adenosylhomocysteine nucleosidase [Candidatus Dependentiae bacterium]|nr:5'-methylthioadenosine/S-adenosylhomocysteine nucleosidase [Candidatus Dependentiae bacterium]
MKKVVISSAFKKEYEFLKKHISNIAVQIKNDFFEIKNIDNESLKLFFLETGIGKVNSSVNVSKLLSEINPDYLIHIGCCGSLTDEVDKGTIICPEKIQEADVCGYFSSRKIPLSINGNGYSVSNELMEIAVKNLKQFNGFNIKFENILTGDFVLLDSKIRQKLKLLYDDSKLKYSGFDMETYAVAAASVKFNIPFIVFRVVVDNCKPETDILNGIIEDEIYSLKKFAEKIYNKSVDKDIFEKSLKTLNEFVSKYIELV